MNRRTSLIAIAALLLFNPCQAEEEFQIPKAQSEKLVGVWKVIKMGKGDQLKDVPEGTMEMAFHADGSGFQKKGDKVIPINWGADDEGSFAIQLKKEDGKGDGIMGSWKLTDEGLRLTIQEFEDGKVPEDRGVLLLERAPQA